MPDVLEHSISESPSTDLCGRIADASVTHCLSCSQTDSQSGCACSPQTSGCQCRRTASGSSAAASGSAAVRRSGPIRPCAQTCADALHAAENSGTIESIPFMPIQVSHSELLAGVSTVVQAFFPSWGASDTVLTQCTNGITNKLVKATHKPSQETILVRTYGKGSDILIDRTQELLNMTTLSRCGMSPPLHGRFMNGIVYGYADGRVFTVDDMRNNQKSKMVAKQLAKWHKINLPSTVPRKPKLFETMKKWIDAIPATYSNPNVANKFHESGLSAPFLKNEIDFLQSKLESLGSPVVFCHNDLLSGNILDLGDSVMFIDYEYGGYCYRGFDIGNHFCEWSGFECDMNLYPNHEKQTSFVTEYLREFVGDDVSEMAVSELVKEVSMFAKCAHLFWGIWSLVQAEISDLEFDYISYAQKRIGEYLKGKNEMQ